MSDIQYFDIEGNPRSLYWMVRNEPDWAESRIRHTHAENEALKAKLARVKAVPNELLSRAIRIEEESIAPDHVRNYGKANGFRESAGVLDTALAGEDDNERT